MMPPGGGITLAAAGSYVYLMHGNTVYQFNAGDLGLVGSKQLPPGGASMMAPAGQIAPAPAGIEATPGGRRSRRGRRNTGAAPGAGAGNPVQP